MTKPYKKRKILRSFVFEKRKYGFELLMDLHKFENNPNVFFDPNPHVIDFFEIMAFEKATGTIDLNGHELEVVDNSFFFICPFQKKSCAISTSGIKGFHLVFQNDFLSDFFDDKLFAYRLQYFYNYQHPQFLQLINEEYDVIKFALNEIVAPNFFLVQVRLRPPMPGKVAFEDHWRAHLPRVLEPLSSNRRDESAPQIRWSICLE